MDENLELLEYIYKNAEMGVYSSEKLIQDINGKENKIKINESYHNQVILPDDGYHSIIRIDNQDSTYYCDPCWDSCYYHQGDKTLPYCLLTKKEMTKDHTLSFEEENYVFDIPYPREYISNVVDLIEKQDNQKVR